jgi:hypothetical protein
MGIELGTAPRKPVQGTSESRAVFERIGLLGSARPDSEHTLAQDPGAKIEAVAEGIGMGTP